MLRRKKSHKQATARRGSRISKASVDASAKGPISPSSSSVVSDPGGEKPACAKSEAFAPVEVKVEASG